MSAFGCKADMQPLLRRHCDRSDLSKAIRSKWLNDAP